MTHLLHQKMSDNSEDKRSSGGLSVGFACFILNIIITQSATHTQFDVLGLGDRWDFHHFMMWTAIGLIIAVICLSWVACVAAASNNDNVGGLTGFLGSLSMVGMIVILVLTYVKMGQMWHNDPTHTIFFYNQFWHEGITDYSVYNQTGHRRLDCHPSLRGVNSLLTTCGERRLMGGVELAPKWVYVMSDVVIRIYGFGLMFVPFILGIVLFCTGSALACGKACKKEESTIPSALGVI